MAKLSQRLGRSWRYKAKKEATTGRRTGGLAAGPTKRARKRQATPKRSSPVRLSSNCSRNLRRCASSTAGYCGMRFALFFHHWINRSLHPTTADDLDGKYHGRSTCYAVSKLCDAASNRQFIIVIFSNPVCVDGMYNVRLLLAITSKLQHRASAVTDPLAERQPHTAHY
eukprot:scpid51712/ scgid34659/ 